MTEHKRKPKRLKRFEGYKIARFFFDRELGCYVLYLDNGKQLMFSPHYYKGKPKIVFSWG